MTAPPRPFQGWRGETVSQTQERIPFPMTHRSPWLRALDRAATLLAMLGCFGVNYALNERLYLHAHTPPRRWPLLLAVALFTPLQSIYILTKKSDVEWRGQRLHVRRDGRAELVSQ
jgi:hypothetical protein